jgi:hypothetical protein
MFFRAVGCGVIAMAVLAVEAGAQHVHTSVADTASPAVQEFLVRARTAAARFQDQRMATRAGYRPLGPDFPGMGYHWVNGELAARGEVDPEHPAIVSYLEVDHKPVLTGVAFALPVKSGDPLPEFPFPGAWHVHSGTVDEETLLLNPASMKHDEADGWRLAMLHAWVVVENPAGVFEQDNWALSFHRLGLLPPGHVVPAQGKALYLLTGGDRYYLRLIELAGDVDAEERNRVAAVLDVHTEKVSDLTKSIRPGDAVSEDTLKNLTEVWSALWRDIEQTVSDETWAQIAMLAG